MEDALWVHIDELTLLNCGACDDGFDLFHLHYPDGYEARWTMEEKIRLLKSPMRFYLGWALAHKLIPDLDFTGQDLRYMDLSNADLEYAQFDQADLRGTNLSYAALYGCSLKGAQLEGAKFADYVEPSEEEEAI